MHFSVFVNCGVAELESRCKVAGLTQVYSDNPQVMANHPGPPNGESGTMMGWPSLTTPRMNYAPDEQVWVPSVVKDESGLPRYWVGFWKDKSPKENELRRHYTQSGPITQLGSQSWKLPTPDTVDSRAVYNDDGSMRWEVVRQFSWVCDEAEQLRKQYLDEFGIRELVFKVEPSEQINWLMKLLQINYRILPEVAVYLDMWVGKDHVIDTVLRTLGLSRKAPTDV